MRVVGEMEWWLPYAKPLPTWDPFTERGYRIALGKVKDKPPAEKLKEDRERLYLGTMLFTEASLGYVWETEYRYFYPQIRLGMGDEEPVRNVGDLMGVKTTYDKKKREWSTKASGLKAVTILRIVEPYIRGKKRREIVRYIIEHGYRPSISTVDEFRRRWRPWLVATTVSGEETVAFLVPLRELY